MQARRLINFIQERLPNTATRNAFNRLATVALPKSLAIDGEGRVLLDRLEQDGNVYLPQLLPNENLLALRRDLESQVCYDPWNLKTPDFKLSDAPGNANNARIRSVATFPLAMEIANHPLVLAIVSNYLGCLPTIDDIVAWWSLPGRPVPKEEQFFHRDRDAVRFVKLFVYLSEVGERDGAHVFVRGSHRVDQLLEPRRRYEDTQVIETFGADQIVPMTGGFGAAFLEDTYGVHKGAVPLGTEPRLLLQIRYTSYPSIWARRETATAPEGFNRYVNRLVV